MRSATPLRSSVVSSPLGSAIRSSSRTSPRRRSFALRRRDKGLLDKFGLDVGDLVSKFGGGGGLGGLIG